VAGAGLGALGTAAMATVTRKEDRPLAAVPLVLGLQQTVEGLVWLSFGSPSLNAATTYAYAGLSYLLWPTYVPFAVLSAEPDDRRRRRIRLYAVAGVVVSLYIVWFMLTEPLTSRVVGHSIRYEIANVRGAGPMFVLYVGSICGSFLSSSHGTLRLLGLMLLVGLAVAAWFYYATLFSVWCFLAAAPSALLLIHVRRAADLDTPAMAPAAAAGVVR